MRAVASFAKRSAVGCRRVGKLIKGANLFQPTDAGEYIIRVLGIDFRDDGTVYLLAINSEDEQVLYVARPL